jgi:hypothetical protein
MRLWSLHPQYLDSKGLVALWREALLAQNVLLGNTKGYKNHPQLERFKKSENPLGAIASYLESVLAEAKQRQYHFNETKIIAPRLNNNITVTNGQLNYEVQHLLRKLKQRDPIRYDEVSQIKDIVLHPLFAITDGDIADWEIR